MVMAEAQQEARQHDCALSADVHLVSGEGCKAQPMAGNFNLLSREGKFIWQRAWMKGGERIGPLGWLITRCKELFTAGMNIHVFGTMKTTVR